MKPSATDIETPVIEVSHVATKFGQAVVHEDISLSIRQGEIFAIAGGNGCGKTTLLREIIGLVTPSSGTIPLFGLDSRTLEMGNGHQILLAEDNEASVEMLQDYFEKHGYQVFAVTNGGEVLPKAEECFPDIILMDIQMPLVNGFEATRRLRADPRFATVPIIALTAFAMPGDRESCLEAGMNEYLSKPLKLKELRHMIEVFLDQPPIT